MNNQTAEPTAHPDSVYQIKSYRLSFLTEDFLRIEYAKDGCFEDRRTLAVINRRLDPVKFTVSQDGDLTVLKTAVLEVFLRPDGKALSKKNLRVCFEQCGKRVEWTPGKADPLNCLGTARTLDRCSGGRYYPEGPAGESHDLSIEKGLISRSGWTEVDDSGTIVLEQQKGRPWPVRRAKGSQQDLYLLTYGLDFKRALFNAARVFGAQPLPPRFSFGYWWSRYWAYLDRELEKIILECEQQAIPLDVLVIDMDWHRQGWTGFSWERAYFPDPDEFMSWARNKGIHISMNLHPADGFAPEEDCYEAVCAALDRDPGKRERVPFDVTDPACMEAYFKIALKHYEDLGVDFWWLDWQQGTESALEGLDPLPWLNELHFEHSRRQRAGHRPLCFSRYGGLGAGRYPVGFSGDTHCTWDSLALQPEFTARSANVLYGYWSHDIGGHYHEEVSGELYTRWLQLGVFSPMLRTHATKQTTNDRQFWEFGLPYSRIMKDAVRIRYEWIPYLYTAARECVESGVSICRPMYYEYPADDNSYEFTDQYMFGDQVLAAPIVSPLDESGRSLKEIWLPEGQWFDCAYGDLVEGGVHRRGYLLEEVPLFVKSGAVLPGQFGAERCAPGSYRNLLVTVYPEADGQGVLYEDDGCTEDYLKGRGAWFDFECLSSGQDTDLKIAFREGDFEGLLFNRSMQVRFPSRVPPRGVLLNGKELSWSYRRTEDAWSYDAERVMVVVSVREVDLKQGVELSLKGGNGSDPRAAYGLPGLLRRLYQAFDVSRVIELDFERELGRMAQTGNRIARNPGSFAEELAALQQGLKSIPETFSAVRKEITGQKHFVEKKLRALEQTIVLLELLES